jgi:hypothetical protein
MIDRAMSLSFARVLGWLSDATMVVSRYKRWLGTYNIAGLGFLFFFF